MSFCDGVLKANKFCSSWNDIIVQQVTETCGLQHLRTFFLAQIYDDINDYVWWLFLDDRWRDGWTVVFTHLYTVNIVTNILVSTVANLTIT